jgi:hypothetical protein
VIFYSLSRPSPGRSNQPTIIRCHATTDQEHDILITTHNPDPPSVFLPAAYHNDVPQALIIGSDVSINLTDDLRQLNRARGQRNFSPRHYGFLVDRVRFRFPLCDNELLQHTARQSLRSCSLVFFPDLGLMRRDQRGTPLPPPQEGPLFDPETGEVY